jgi:quinol monooxygenase YgiN
MPLISVTRLHLRSFWCLPKFFWHANRSASQARKAPGNLGVDLLKDPGLSFLTKTAWKDEAAMRAYMLSGAHRKAMPSIGELADEATTTHWEQASAALPSWPEARKRLDEKAAQRQ